MTSEDSNRSKRRGQRETKILLAARQLLEERGHAGFAVAELAAQIGVSEGTVFNYFPTRRDLMFRVVRDWMAPVVDRLESDLHRVAGARNRLVFFSARHLIETAEAPGLHRLVYRELHWENYYGSDLHQINKRYAGLVTWIIAQGQAAGEIRPEVDPMITRDALFGTLHHVTWRTLLNNRPLNFEKSAEIIVDQLFSGIATDSQPTGFDRAIDRLDALADRLENVRKAIAQA
jgi:TetR/AcrR family transcriptional regulator, fatty acid metabolism regulator protein